MWFAFGSTDSIKLSPAFGLCYYYYFKIRITFSIDISFPKLLQLVPGHLFCWGTIFLEQGSNEYWERVMLNFQKAIQLPPTCQWQTIGHLSCFGVISLKDHDILSNMFFKIHKAIWPLDLTSFLINQKRVFWKKKSNAVIDFNTGRLKS